MYISSVALYNLYIDCAVQASQNESEYSMNEQNLGIGKFCRTEINAGKTNTEILKLVKKKFPKGHTTYACVAWYRSNMKKNGTLHIKKVAAPKKEKAPTEVPTPPVTEPTPA